MMQESRTPSPDAVPFRDKAEIPGDAIDLFPRHCLQTGIFLLKDNTILKAGYRVKKAEAEALRYVSEHTSIPVPEVYVFYEKNGIGCIIMSKIEGRMLGETWSSLAQDKKLHVVNQLRGYIQELRNLRGDFYGALWNMPSQDIFFDHLCVAPPREMQYGPYTTRAEYNQGLIDALTNSRPGGRLRESDAPLIDKILATKEDAKIFSHGDLHLGNILINEDSDITGIVDWGEAGFSIPGREYLETLERSEHPDWISLIPDMFPEDAKLDYDVLK